LRDFRFLHVTDAAIALRIRLCEKSEFACSSNVFRPFKPSTQNKSIADNQKL